MSHGSDCLCLCEMYKYSIASTITKHGGHTIAACVQPGSAQLTYLLLQANPTLASLIKPHNHGKLYIITWLFIQGWAVSFFVCVFHSFLLHECRAIQTHPFSSLDTHTHTVNALVICMSGMSWTALLCQGKHTPRTVICVSQPLSSCLQCWLARADNYLQNSQISI